MSIALFYHFIAKKIFKCTNTSKVNYKLFGSIVSTLILISCLHYQATNYFKREAIKTEIIEILEATKDNPEYKSDNDVVTLLMDLYLFGEKDEEFYINAYEKVMGRKPPQEDQIAEEDYGEE